MEMHTAAPSSLAARARALGGGASWAVRRIVGCAPRAPSSAARSAAISIVASDSDRPLGPTVPGSSGPWPGSMATQEPTNVCSFSMRRTSSASRTTARLGPSTAGRSRSMEPIASSVEPQRIQALLELADIVSLERQRAEVQDPVAQPVSGLHELAPRVDADHPVRGKSSPLLEGLDRLFGGGAESALELLRLDPEAEIEEAMLDVADGLSPVP